MKIKVSLFLIILFFSCKSEDHTEASFSVKELLKEKTNQVILPLIENFVAKVTEFNTHTTTYIENTNESHLEQLRSSWREVALSYEKIYAFNIGKVRELFIHDAIYSWPTTTSSIESILSKNTITEEVLDRFSPEIKSIAALEYLLFSDHKNKINEQFATFDNRKAYLRWSALFLKSQAERIQNIWNASGENYANTFINNNATGIDNSFNLFFNGLYNLIDTAKVTKIGKPAGLEKSKNINLNITQAFYSDTSLAILKANMETLSKVYFKYNNGLGIEDYVFSIKGDQELNNLVKLKIEEIFTAIDKIKAPFDIAIFQDKVAVKELYNKLEELQILFAADLRSILSIIITSTDNDGD